MEIFHELIVILSHFDLLKLGYPSIVELADIDEAVVLHDEGILESGH